LVIFHFTESMSGRLLAQLANGAAIRLESRRTNVP